MNAPRSASEFLPVSIELEQALIGVCLMEPAALASLAGQIESENFSEPIHRQIWEIAQTLAGAGHIVNPVTLAAVMGRDTIVAEGMKLSAYLARCCADTSCPPAYAIDFARQIRSSWALRELILATETARSEAMQPSCDSRALILELMQRLDETRTRLDPRRSGFRSASDVTVAVVDRMAQHYAGTASRNAITTGLADVDRIMNGGLQPGDLVIMAGRPGMGKTLTAVSMSRQSAAKGHAGGFFSLEMTQEQIGSRYLSDAAFDYMPSNRLLSSGRILHGDVDAPEAEQVIDVAREFEKLPLSIDDSSSMSVGEISARTRTLADQFARKGQKLKHVWIDYLKFVRASERYRGQRHYEVGEISSGLKSLAKDLDVAVILLAQLNRNVESREDKRPQLSDLRESGDLEADADVVIFLYREAYYLALREPKPGTPEYEQWMTSMSDAHAKLEIIIAKQRMGSTGSIEAFCSPGASAVRDRADPLSMPRVA
jgi:replicative DNA helicase